MNDFQKQNKNFHKKSVPKTMINLPIRNNSMANINKAKSKNLRKKFKDTKKGNLSLQKESLISIHHINSRGTVGKIEEIYQYVEENKPDILLISETKLDESVSNTLCEPPGYKIIRKDRSEKFKKKYNMTGSGGGIAVLHKKEIKVEIFTKNKEETEEILWVYVKGKKSFLLGIVYNTNYCKLMCNKKNESVFEKHLKEASLIGCNTFVLGDFNIDLREKCSKTKKLKNMFKNYANIKAAQVAGIY